MEEKEVNGERGQLKPKEWVTIYAHATPSTFFVQLFGSIPGGAKINVEIDGTIHGTLTQSNPNMYANGKKIRLYNDGREPQGYHYYPA